MSTAFNELCECGTLEEVQQAIDAGADVAVQDDDGETCLMAATENPDVRVILLLLRTGADVNAQTSWGATALTQAVKRKSGPEVIAALIDAGANPNVQIIDGWPALKWAVEGNPNPEVIEVLIRGGADVRITGLLDVCNLNRNKEAILPILQAAGATNRGDPKSMSFKEHCKYGTPEEVQQAITAGADVTERDQHGGTCLMDATDNPDVAVIPLLVQSGADVNAQTKNGQTALMLAAMSTKTPQVICALIDAGADPNLQNRYGWTALKWAAQENPNPGVIHALIKGGCYTHIDGLVDICERSNKNKEAVLAVLKAAGAK